MTLTVRYKTLQMSDTCFGCFNLHVLDLTIRNSRLVTSRCVSFGGVRLHHWPESVNNWSSINTPNAPLGLAYSLRIHKLYEWNIHWSTWPGFFFFFCFWFISFVIKSNMIYVYMIYYIIILLGARATLRVLVQLCAVSNVLASHLHPYSR